MKAIGHLNLNTLSLRPTPPTSMFHRGLVDRVGTSTPCPFGQPLPLPCSTVVWSTWLVPQHPVPVANLSHFHVPPRSGRHDWYLNTLSLWPSPPTSMFHRGLVDMVGTSTPCPYGQPLPLPCSTAVWSTWLVPASFVQYSYESRCPRGRFGV